MSKSIRLPDVNQVAPIDLLRLRTSIDKKLNDPALLNRSKAQLKAGNIVQFYSSHYDCMRNGTIFELFQKYAGVEDADTKERWKIPYYAIDLSHIQEGQRILTGRDFKIGQKVSFEDKRNHLVYRGMVAKLNQKTATIVTSEGHEFRVSYSGLINCKTPDVI
ncbi:hypothetical protein Psal006b_03579 (plasmid) [Piscirickettsia salmonis]|uniref:Uncharacterized protein n=2 Tax=Piscirickettsia salmonis TaxID=1238 RepID=A0A0K2L847_PISSA|nr:hypothetical protein [Piscirickettsia salmonis]ALT18965.1 hypothetical protein PSLF89_09015 [Piscirickettsia salmonis LF-89 = ATCC VR-1361]ALA26674.1 hypothetical protein KW89_3p48 [Piscirickettsia salmonis]ALB24343.1 hypothetical protein KU39_1p2 [Piscirickettsia salmonis]ALY04374.1 hypothetical protein AWE47_17580 [Piscirickettsia salmonis]AMA44062.1 hypothetical protein AWJ11_16925 [Piscirickettsia salmonis]